MPVTRIVLAHPRGFCAGVEKAINALAWMTRIFPPPIYCYHEIVHNQIVVQAFMRAGVVFVDDVSEVPPGSPLMLSAHGTAPAVLEEARDHGAVVIDAVCPLVTKVHHEIKTRARKGYRIVYVGHRGHEEAIGAVAEAPEAVELVEELADADRLEPDARPVALLAQTTLAVPEWSIIADRVKARLGEVWMPSRSDLCYATTNRQAAVEALASKVDALVVIGSANSSNTRALVRVAQAAGVPRVERVNSATELPSDLEGVVGVTAGASAAEGIVLRVVEALAPTEGIETVTVTTEDEFFPAPPELRELVGGLAAAVTLLTDRPAGSDPLGRESAWDALAAIVPDPI